jgi:HrpA-like RNA helicase
VRVGRTSSGEYYSLYDFTVDEKKYPTPQICQSDLVGVEFSLRKSPLKQGLDYLKKYLPNPPIAGAIQAAVNELKRLG